MKSPFSAYKDIISRFVEKKISATQFEKKFMQLFNYDKLYAGEVYDILSPLFWAVEDFCSYPELRDQDDIDEHQLMEAAKDTLRKIRLEDARWDILLATDESQKLLEEMADQAWEEIQAGHARRMVFSDNGRIRPE